MRRAGTYLLFVGFFGLVFTVVRQIGIFDGIAQSPTSPRPADLAADVSVSVGLGGFSLLAAAAGLIMFLLSITQTRDDEKERPR